MSIISKYLTREIIRHFVVILALVVTVYLAVDFFEKFNDFMSAGAPLVSVLWYFLYKIPFVVAQILPVGLMLAVVVTFGLMSKRNELIALKCTGVSIFHLFKPVAVLGVVCTLLLFCLSEVVVPAFMARANRIWLQDVKKVSALTGRERGHWLKGNHAFYNFSQYDPVNRVMYGFSAFFVDGRFQLVRRLDARQGRFVNGRWVFKDLLSQSRNAATGRWDARFYAKASVPTGLRPKELKEVAKPSDEMNFRDLWTLIKKVESEGYDATRYRVDLNKKIAFPWICLVMCLMGMGIAVKANLREGLPVMVAFGILAAFLYWIVLSFCLSLGYGHVLPPPAAAWAANVIFLCAGGIILINAE